MKYKRGIRLLSALLSLVLAGSSLNGYAGRIGLAASVPAVQTEAASEPAGPEAAVPVIVTLDADFLLSDGRQADYLCTPEAAAQCEVLRAEQDRIIAGLTELYPLLNADYRFLTLTNGFSCSMPASLIPAAEAFPGVRSVSRSSVIDCVPDMSDALDIGGISSFYNDTGCRGEGQVIAVIDSELDLNHPMFAALPDQKQTKLTKHTVSAIASGVGFHVNISGDNAYYSSKVPFAADYLDKDPRAVRNPDPEEYHGTHVSGIAAGNAFQTDDGALISGVAPDAQLVFMAIDGPALTNATFIAALEDAVKLQADAANISLGTAMEVLDADNPFRDAVNAAEAAGVSVCIAAGNDGNGEDLGFIPEPDQPDVSKMNGFITEDTRALAVASADNKSQIRLRTAVNNGQSIGYSGYTDSSSAGTGALRYIGDVLGEGPFEYEYCGLGYETDFPGKNMNGKLALLDRGIISFTEKAKNAAAVGAVGVICIQNSPEAPSAMVNDASVPVAMITVEAGEMLKQAWDKRISFTGGYTYVQQDTGVSEYSGWGAHNSLDLRPDIMGIGGNVRSAAYDSQTSVQSGTSMAAPYLTGCTALLTEYLREQGSWLTGSERARRIRNLLMSTAVPYESGGLPVSPRRQGAGLVSLDNAARTRVILTGERGETKINLRDQLGAGFSFTVTLNNLSSEAVHFDSARLVLTTDHAFYDQACQKVKIEGQQKLNCEADLTGLLDSGAWETRTVNVQVTLDAQQEDQIRQTFVNGFFIEGYLYLEGAQNNPDLSIPLLGFSDDFAAISIYGDSVGGFVSWDANGIPGYKSISGFLMDHLTEFRKAANAGSYEQLMQFNASAGSAAEKLFVSPNDDGLADFPGIRMNSRRDALVIGGELQDAEGNTVIEGYEMTENPVSAFSAKELTAFPVTFVYGTKQRLNELPDGDYTLVVSAGITREALTNAPQIRKLPVTIDKVAPRLDIRQTEAFGRKILQIRAQDKYLDSIMILGSGTGKLRNAWGVRTASFEDFNALLMALTLNVSSRSDTGSAFLNWYNDAYQKAAASHQNLPDYECENFAPIVNQLRGDYTDEEWLDHYDFTEYIEAKPDANGFFTVEYDVTDMECYYIAAADRAYNFTASDHADETVRPDQIEPGVYAGQYGLYEFRDGQMYAIPLGYHAVPFHADYTVRVGTFDSVMQMRAADGEADPFEWKCRLTAPAEGEYLLDFSYAEFANAPLRIPDLQQEHLKKTGISTLEGYIQINTEDAERDFVRPLMYELTGCERIDAMSYACTQDAVVTFSADCCTGRGELIEHVSITVDLKTGIATLPDGSQRDLLHHEVRLTGDVDCSGRVDVADAVLLARYAVSDRTAVISTVGVLNGDCDHNGQTEAADIALILQAIARMIELT